MARQALDQTPEGRPDYCAALGWFLLSAGSITEATALLVSSIGRYPGHAALHWYLGLVHVQEQRLDEAVNALLTAVRFDPKLDEAAVSLAWVLGDLGRYDEAVFYARQAIAIASRPDRVGQLGWLLLSHGAVDEAVLQLEAALTLQPEQIDVRCNLSTALMRLERSDEALAILEQGLAFSPEAAPLLQLQIPLLLDFNRIEEARMAADRLLALAPENAASYLLAAISHERSDQLETALEYAKEAITSDGLSAQAWRTLAQVHSRQGQLDEAHTALQTALGLEPHNASTTYRQLGWVYTATKRYEDAVAAFTNAVKTNAQDISSWHGMAEAHHAAKQFKEALVAIRAALKLHPEFPDALHLLGCILISAGPDSWRDAVPALQEALRLEPQRIETHMQLSVVLGLLGRHDEALEVLADGITLSPEASMLQHQQIRGLMDLGRTDDARKACHLLLQQHKQDGTAWYLLSQVLVQRKRLRLASHAVSRARRLAPALPEIWLQTGWLALETDDLPTAREAVAQLQLLAPENSTGDILATLVWERSGNLHLASDHAEKAVARAPQSVPAWQGLAKVRTSQGRLADAQAALHAAIALDPEDAGRSYRQLGWVCIADGRYEDAIAAFSTAVQNPADDSTSWIGLAEAQHAADRSDDALRSLRGALVLRRDWPEANQLRRRVLGEKIAASMNRAMLGFGTENPQQPQPAPAPLDAPRIATQSAQYEYALCSFCTQSHLPLLRTLVASARKHFAGEIYLLLVDSDDASLLPEGTIPVRMRDLIEGSVWDDMVKRYNILELCCTLKPFLMRHAARATQCPVVYLDADTYLLGPLHAALPETPDFSVFLTPHLLMPFSGVRHVEEIGTMRIGVYNGGLVGVGTDRDALAFLDWWADRVSRYAYDAPEHGVFTDQKWIDLVPSFFRNVHISRDWGLNVGPWRVRTEQDFAKDALGQLTFCGSPVRVMHMSRFNPEKPDMLTSSLPLARTTNSPLGQFLRQYAAEVIGNRQHARA